MTYVVRDLRFSIALEPEFQRFVLVFARIELYLTTFHSWLAKALSSSAAPRTQGNLNVVLLACGSS